MGSIILQIIFAGTTIGMIYALVALGFHLIYKGTGVINFAQGEFLLLGSMLMWFFWVNIGFNVFLAFLLTIVCSTLAAILVERVTFAPLRNQPHLTLIMVLLAVAALYTHGMLFAFGNNPLSVPSFLSKTSLSIFGAGVHSQAILVAVIFILSLFGVHFLFTRTMWGRSMVATMINKEGAKIIGVNVDLVSLYAFALSAAVSAAAGALIAPISGAYYARGFIWSVKGFTAAIVGGIETTIGVIVGGLLVGLIEMFLATVFSADLAEMFLFIMLIVTLWIKPAGLLGIREAKK